MGLGDPTWSAQAIFLNLFFVMVWKSDSTEKSFMSQDSNQISSVEIFSRHQFYLKELH